MIRAILYMIIAMLAASVAEAESVAAFYAAHPITITVGSFADGAYGIYTAALAEHLGKHIPGRPRFHIVFRPGDGGLDAANELANASPRDGSAIGAIRGANLVESLLNPKAPVHFDPRQLNWIGNISQQHGTCIAWATGGLASLDQARSREVVVGASSLLANDGTTPRLLNALIGTKFKIVTGYEIASLARALESGEIEAICGLSYSTLSTQQPAWIKEKKVRFFAQTGFERNAALPDVPLVSDYARSDDDRLVLRLLDDRELMGRPYVAPAGVPSDRLAALREGFDRTMRDPDFLATAARRAMIVDPTDHRGMAAMIADAYAMPKDIVDKAASLMQGGAGQ